MYKFPPGYTKRIMIGIGAGAVCAVLLGVTIYGGRPTAQEEANRSARSLEALYNKLHKK